MPRFLVNRWWTFLLGSSLALILSFGSPGASFGMTTIRGSQVAGTADYGDPDIPTGGGISYPGRMRETDGGSRWAAGDSRSAAAMERTLRLRIWLDMLRTVFFKY
jgi:hypothetical protein